MNISREKKTNSIFFGQWVKIILPFYRTKFATVVKTAFTVSNRTLCGKTVLSNKSHLFFTNFGHSAKNIGF